MAILTAHSIVFGVGKRASSDAGAGAPPPTCGGVGGKFCACCCCGVLILFLSKYGYVYCELFICFLLGF
jgi:hypothetical protein